MAAGNPYQGAIYADPGFVAEEAAAERAWQEWAAKAGMTVERLKAAAREARTAFDVERAQDIKRLTENMAARGLYFSGLTATGVGRISTEYMRQWTAFMNEMADRYTELTQQGWDTATASSQAIVDAARKWLAETQRVYIGGV